MATFFTNPEGPRNAGAKGVPAGDLMYTNFAAVRLAGGVGGQEASSPLLLLQGEAHGVTILNC
jgi:hypothetical protein